MEAIEKKCNLIVAHHPIIFSGLKKITGKNYVEKTIIAAIKNDIAIYAIHTNLDNVLHGVNGKIADKLGLINRKILQPKKGTLKKLFTFVPVDFAEKVRSCHFCMLAADKLVITANAVLIQKVPEHLKLVKEPIHLLERLVTGIPKKK